ncbi:hypothetical protein [Herbaspirillum sp. ST 5-3]|uniref:hypothetical protein n=1 Tax=Oxalobacteraceae TaxID=75682 RepID=UPI0010A53975|nr:hypothetical protein [Herbaspirillum sp. ST 5-3]
MFPVAGRLAVVMTSLVLLLSACGEGPGDPRPPYSPPRPMTSLGHVSTAQLEIPARPAPAPPGEM